MNVNIFLVIGVTGLVNACLFHVCGASVKEKSVFVFGEDKTRQKRSGNLGLAAGGQPDIAEFRISSQVEARFATVVVFSRMVNKQNTSREATFTVQIPQTAFISKFALVINGTRFLAQVYEKKEAQKKYDEAKKHGQTAGQVSEGNIKMRRDMDIFNINVNVAANSEVSFELTYQELLERRRFKYIQRFNIQPLQIVPDLTLKADFNEPQGFKEFTFTLPQNTTEMTDSGGNTNLLASPTTRAIIYKPTIEEQKTFDVKSGIDGEFVVTYDVNQRQDGGVMIIKDDCFNHYLAPKNLQPLGKNIVFVVDISGSMSGNKIKQARESLLVILDKLKSGDIFNILLFDQSVRTWAPKMQTADKNNIERAKVYARENVQAEGGTDINEALLEAVNVLKNSMDVEGTRANLIVFLTDGDPTNGVTNTKNIRNNVLEANNGPNRIAIFSLAFGFNLNTEFLKRLSWENSGFMRRIYDEQDASSQLTNFYLEIESPVLMNVDIKYDTNDVDPEQVTQVKYLQYFDGTEIVVAGRTKAKIDRPDKMHVSVVGVSKEGKMNLKVVSRKLLLPKETGAVCKLYAYLKIKDLLREMAVAKSDEEAEMLESKALNMSLKNGFVTPLTSLLVVQGDFKNVEHNMLTNKMSSGSGFELLNIMIHIISLVICIVILK